jgi:hypothetical protein
LEGILIKVAKAEALIRAGAAGFSKGQAVDDRRSNGKIGTRGKHRPREYGC